jgi:hypothetical protein
VNDRRIQEPSPREPLELKHRRQEAIERRGAALRRSAQPRIVSNEITASAPLFVVGPAGKAARRSWRARFRALSGFACFAGQPGKRIYALNSCSAPDAGLSASDCVLSPSPRSGREVRRRNLAQQRAKPNGALFTENS